MKTTLDEADPKGALATGGRPTHPWAPTHGGEAPGLCFEPRSSMIFLSYKLLFLLLF